MAGDTFHTDRNKDDDRITERLHAASVSYDNEWAEAYREDIAALRAERDKVIEACGEREEWFRTRIAERVAEVERLTAEVAEAKSTLLVYRGQEAEVERLTRERDALGSVLAPARALEETHRCDGLGVDGEPGGCLCRWCDLRGRIEFVDAYRVATSEQEASDHGQA